MQESNSQESINLSVIFNLRHLQDSYFTENFFVTDLSHSSGLVKEIFDSDQVYQKKLEADAKVCRSHQEGKKKVYSK